MAERALKIDKNCANAWLNKGNLQFLMGDINSARSCYNNAKKVGKHKAQAGIDGKVALAAAYTNLGNIYYEQEDYENAILQYLESLKVDENDADTLGNLGLSLTQT